MGSASHGTSRSAAYATKTATAVSAIARSPLMSASPLDLGGSPQPAAHRPERQQARISRRVAAGTAMPMVLGIVMAAGVRAGAALTIAVATLAIAGITSMYRSRQETRRKEIEWHSVN